jgi:hypothetical protein
MTTLTQSLPDGDYFVGLAGAWATLLVLAFAIVVYRMWLAACRDRKNTKEYAVRIAPCPLDRQIADSTDDDEARRWQAHPLRVRALCSARHDPAAAALAEPGRATD